MNGLVPHSSNYGIRCDANNSSITRNKISNYTYGILVRLQDYTNPPPVTWCVIGGNTLYEGRDTAIYTPVAAISVSGTAANPIAGLSVIGNTAYSSGLWPITVYHIEDAVFQNNNILNQPL